MVPGIAPVPKACGLPEGRRRPKGWKVEAVAESFCSAFGLDDVTKGSCWLAFNGVPADLPDESLADLTSSGENAVRVVPGVPCTDSSLKEEWGDVVYLDMIQATCDSHGMLKG